MHLSVYSSQALFHSLLLDPVAALCNGNDPDWRRYICGAEARYIGLVIGEILIDAPERVLGRIRKHDHDMRADIEPFFDLAGVFCRSCALSLPSLAHQHI